MATEQATDFTLDTAAELAAEEHGSIEGHSPWLLAWRRLRRNWVALGFLVLFVLIVVACALASVYAHHVAHTGPNDNHVADSITIGGKSVPVVSQGGVTFKNGQAQLNNVGGVGIGPQWFSAGGKYVLGADNSGRDVAVRLLYGGINSLKIRRDRKSTRLNSSHVEISYAVFCLKKKKKASRAL